MAAPRKCPDELRERATRMAVEARRNPAARDGAIARTADRPGTTTDQAQRLVELERENRELRRADAILKSASAFSRRSSTVHAPGESVHRHPPAGVRGRADLRHFAGCPVHLLRRQEAGPVSRSRTDEVASAKIAKVHEENYAVYGARGVHTELNRQGHRVARRTVQRLMKRSGPRGIARVGSEGLRPHGAQRGPVEGPRGPAPEGRRVPLTDRRPGCSRPSALLRSTRPRREHSPGSL